MARIHKYNDGTKDVITIEGQDADQYKIVNGKLVKKTQPDLANDAKPRKLIEINAAFDQAMNALVTGYPEREIASWPQQEREARAFTADPTAATPLLDAIAAACGVNKDVLAAKIVTKADQFAAVAGALIGKRQALEDAINVAKTVADVEAAVWEDEHCWKSGVSEVTRNQTSSP